MLQTRRIARIALCGQAPRVIACAKLLESNLIRAHQIQCALDPIWSDVEPKEAWVLQTAGNVATDLNLNIRLEMNMRLLEYKIRAVG